MIKTFCDNCGRELRDKPDEANRDNSDWKPDARGHLTLTVEQDGKSKVFALDMDLCLRCSRTYLKELKKPIGL